LVNKRTFEKNKDCPLLKFECFEHAKNWFVLSFEHVNFLINGKYSNQNYDNSNYYGSFVIFQTYKNLILRNAHSLGWLLWLCVYPINLKNQSIVNSILNCHHKTLICSNINDHQVLISSFHNMGVSLLKNLKKMKINGEKVKIVSLLGESMG
jgi:hypothetical protein